MDLEWNGLNIPLLIGGATTSRRHTAIKIEEQYTGFTTHVTDASRSVGVVGKILNEETKDDFIDSIKKDYIGIRDSYLARDKMKNNSTKINYVTHKWECIIIPVKCFVSIIG